MFWFWKWFAYLKISRGWPITFFSSDCDQQGSMLWSQVSAVFQIFGEKIGVFLKYQCHDQFYSKFSFVLSKKRHFLAKKIGKNTVVGWINWHGPKLEACSKKKCKKGYVRMYICTWGSSDTSLTDFQIGSEYVCTYIHGFAKVDEHVCLHSVFWGVLELRWAGHLSQPAPRLTRCDGEKIAQNVAQTIFCQL
jgi:hypothetical protein